MPPSSKDENQPEAIPVKRETLRKARVELQDLPQVILPKEGRVRELPPEPQAEIQEVVEAKKEGNVPEAPRRAQRTPAFQQPPVEKGSSINRKALESTNRGKSPSSRWFVRGILHPAPIKVAMAAFFAIVFQISFVVFLVVMILFVFDKMDARQYWWLAAICPVVGLLFLMTASRVRCRVCGQKEFIPSGALKHVKTHRFLMAGPIFCTAIHVLIFKWFHCMFCGTAVRIKK